MSYQLTDLRAQKDKRSKEELLRHMKGFQLDVKVSVGIWYFTPAGGRFHDRYVPEASVEERIKMAYDLAELGVKGIEAHYPNEINEDNVHLYEKLQKDTGIRVVGIAFAHFFDKEFEFGSLSNPYPEIRQKAIEIAIGGLKLVQRIGADFAISWPGIDGYLYPLGTLFYQMWDNYESSLATAMDEVPGVRVAIEPKPYEPSPNNILRTTDSAIIAAREIESRLKNETNINLLKEGHTLVGLNPEIGHVRMGGEEVAGAFARVLREGRLAHTHWNSQPLGNYDQDLNIGVVAPEQSQALLYILKMAGYREYFGIDINPERMPVNTAVELNIKALNKFNEGIERLPHERIIECYYDPANHRGEIERILLENM